MEYAVYTHGSRNKPQIALTFDDGPNPPRTEEVLEVLADRNVRATFFVIGKWVERFPETVRNLMRAGHVVGNHTYSHSRLSDYELAESMIAQITGKPTSFFANQGLCSALAINHPWRYLRTLDLSARTLVFPTGRRQTRTKF